LGKLIEEKTISKELVTPFGKNGQDPLTQTSFRYQLRGRRDVGKPTKKKDGKTKNTSSFKGTGLKT
jgi:hypothetical protein